MASLERVSIQEAVLYVTDDNDSDYSVRSDEEFAFSSSTEEVKLD